MKRGGRKSRLSDEKFQTMRAKSNGDYPRCKISKAWQHLNYGNIMTPLKLQYFRAYSAYNLMFQLETDLQPHSMRRFPLQTDLCSNFNPSTLFPHYLRTAAQPNSKVNCNEPPIANWWAGKLISVLHERICILANFKKKKNQKVD